MPAARSTARSRTRSGQRNWHEVDTFNLEWSLHLRGDKAVKDAYAGFDWDAAMFAAKLDATTQRLELLGMPPRTLEPGEYRAYLAPRALEEITNLLNWDGYSAKARATKQSPLLRMELGEKLSPKVSLTENTQNGVAPGFQQDGFVKPKSVTLIADGEVGQALVSPRSAKEYGLEANGASSRESPESLEMAAGALAAEDALAALDTGLYIGNLWYLNFSDRPAGRITGMTRFATFWVEGGPHRRAGQRDALRRHDLPHARRESRWISRESASSCSTLRPTTSAPPRARGCPARCSSRCGSRFS